MTSFDDGNPPSIMAYINPPDLPGKRKRAAQLLDAVIDERMEARLAINRWPEAEQLPDPSLECAYQALWHFESDEERHKTELFYLDAQLELLRQMVAFLEKGQPLPPYMLKMYRAEQRVHFFYARSLFEESRRYLLQLGQQALHAWKTAIDVYRNRGKR